MRPAVDGDEGDNRANSPPAPSARRVWPGASPPTGFSRGESQKTKVGIPPNSETSPQARAIPLRLIFTPGISVAQGNRGDCQGKYVLLRSGRPAPRLAHRRI
jgi:hypothetical protein